MVERIQINPSNRQEILDAAAQNPSPTGPSPLRATSNFGSGTTHRVVFKGNEASYSETSQTIGNASDPSPVRNELAGQIVTARSSFGRPLSGSEITPTSIVKVPGGFEMEVRSARAAGFIVERNGELYYSGDAGNPTKGFKQASNSVTQSNNGTDANSSNNDRSNAPEQDNEAPTDQAENAATFDKAAGEVIGQALQNMRDGEVQALSREMIQSGTLSPEAIALAAQRLGTTNEEASAKAATVHAAYYKQASETIGPHAETVFEYARTNAPQELRRAIRVSR